MIDLEYKQALKPKVLAVFSAKRGDNMEAERITCLGERQ
jgi:hypothetical protein